MTAIEMDLGIVFIFSTTPPIPSPPSANSSENTDKQSICFFHKSEGKMGKKNKQTEIKM